MLAYHLLAYHCCAQHLRRSSNNSTREACTINSDPFQTAMKSLGTLNELPQLRSAHRQLKVARTDSSAASRLVRTSRRSQSERSFACVPSFGYAGGRRKPFLDRRQRAWARGLYKSRGPRGACSRGFTGIGGKPRSKEHGPTGAHSFGRTGPPMRLLALTSFLGDALECTE